MKNILLTATLFLTVFTANANESIERTYIVNEDGTVTFLNRVMPSQDEAGRTYIVNEDGTITFLNRVAPTRFDVELMEDVRVQLEDTLSRVGNR